MGGRSGKSAPVMLVARARLCRHWLGIAVVGLVAALAGAGVIALVAGARRTDTAYERLRVETNAPDGRVSVLEPDAEAADEAVTRARILPEIGESTVARFRVGRRTDTQDWISTISLPALDAASSRPQIVRGRSFRIGNPDEAVISQSTAAAIGLDLGDRLPIDYYSDQQFFSVLDNYFIEPAGESVNLRIVGVTRDPDDAAGGRTVLVGPRLLVGSDTTAGFPGILVRLAPGVTRADAERALAGIEGLSAADVVWADATAQALDSTRNAIVTGLLVAAAVIALAGLIAVAQAAARQVDQSATERDALVALGLPRRARIAASTAPGALAALVAVVGGSAGAIALSSRFPTGRIAEFEPHPGVAVNVAIIGIGAAVLGVVVMSAFAVAAWRVERRTTQAGAGARPAWFAPRANRWAFGPTALMGARFALERGPDARAVPVRTSLVGIVVGMAGVVAAITFSASLQGFIGTPAHYGQPWDLSIETLGDDGAPARLAADRDVEAAAIIRSVGVTVDGRPTVVGSVTGLKGSLVPTLVSGRLPRGPGEIVLGPKLLDASGASIGEDVEVRARTRMKLRVVGTALNIDPQDLSFGTTAFVAPEAFRQVLGDAGLFNEETALRFRPGADAVAATDRLKAAIPLGLTDESLPSRPAAVGNVAELGRLPQMIALVLAAIGAIAVAHAVVVAARRRRHDLAVLAVLGMTRPQRARIVVSMAATLIGLGILVGVPLGILLGTYVWNVMASGLTVDWSAVVPVLEVLGVAVVALGLAVLVALLPARGAFRMRPAAELRRG